MHFVIGTLTDFVSIEEISSQNRRDFLKSVDLLAIISLKNIPFMTIYDDGSIERKIIIE